MLLPSESLLNWLKWELYRDPESDEWAKSFSVLLEHTLHLHTNTKSFTLFEICKITSSLPLTQEHHKLSVASDSVQGIVHSNKRPRLIFHLDQVPLAMVSLLKVHPTHESLLQLVVAVSLSQTVSLYLNTKDTSPKGTFTVSH